MKIRLVVSSLILLTLGIIWGVTNSSLWLFNQADDGSIVAGLIILALVFIFLPPVYAFAWKKYLKPWWIKKTTASPKEEK